MVKKARKRNATTTINTTGGAVRITESGSPRNKPSARETASVVVDVVTPKAVDGFMDFLRERAVVGLAIGVVIGTQLKVITDSLNSGFINPLFGLLFNGTKLNEQVATISWRGRIAELQWGVVIYQIISFLFVLATFYAIIKFFRLDKFDKKSD